MVILYALYKVSKVLTDHNYISPCSHSRSTSLQMTIAMMTLKQPIKQGLTAKPKRRLADNIQQREN